MKTSSNPSVGFRNGITPRLLGLVAIIALTFAALFGPSKARAATYTMAVVITSTSGSGMMVAEGSLNVPANGWFTIRAGFCDPLNQIHNDTWYYVYGKTPNGGWTEITHNQFMNATCGVGFHVNTLTSTVYVGYKIRAITYVPGHTGEPLYLVGIANTEIYDVAYAPAPDARNGVQPLTGPGHTPDMIASVTPKTTPERMGVKRFTYVHDRDRRFSTTQHI